MPYRNLINRTATLNDYNAIQDMITTCINELLPDVLNEYQVSESHTVMGVDTRLIADETYYLFFDEDKLVGCGGWSRRKTLYGGNTTKNRNDELSDPATEPAKIRAMYTHPQYTRLGIATEILHLCEEAARKNGFKIAELGSTASGRPLYEKHGYQFIDDISVISNGVRVPIFKMRKRLVPMGDE